jgi:hypothetical protein
MKSILTTKTNFMLGTVSLLALAALTTGFMTTATTPAAFAQPNGETIKKICGDTAIGFERGTCKYPITFDCSFAPGSIEQGGFCWDFSTFPEQMLGRADLVCNQGGEPSQINGDECVGKPTGPNGP